MNSDNTAPDSEAREGQDHDEAEVPTLAEIRFARLMRLLCGLAVPVVAVIGLVRIAEADDLLDLVLESAGTIVAVVVTAAFCALAGVQATQLQTVYDEATAPSTHQ
jgi:hypothetical protein